MISQDPNSYKLLKTWILLFGLGILAGVSLADVKSPELTVIENFYKQYLNHGKQKSVLSAKSKHDSSQLEFSKSFKKLRDLDSRTCKEKAGTDICGWGADGDVFLDTQEVDSQLTFQNANFLINEPSPGTVEVRFNVYPSMKENRKYYDKKIQFKMILENNKWVVDDLITKGKSAREIMRGEIQSFEK